MIRMSVNRILPFLLLLIGRLICNSVKGRDILRVELAAKVNRTLVSKWETLEEIDKHPAAKHCIFCAREPAKKLVA